MNITAAEAELAQTVSYVGILGVFILYCLLSSVIIF